jgi:hypothetical protein
MFRYLILLPLLVSSLCVPGIASAQSMLDMKGTWTGTSRSIVSGLPSHHPATVAAKPAGPNRLTELKFTIKVDGQQDSRFWGTVSSAAKVDPFIGVLSADGKQLRMVLQNGGVFDGTVVNADSIEIFYTEWHSGVSVAATNLWTRQK